jgi:urate oxidase
MEVLKTTQSGWEKFHQSACSTLPGTTERILATRISASWTYCAPSVIWSTEPVDFCFVHARVLDAFQNAFYGPPTNGTYSPGIQHTLHTMATAVLASVPEVATVTLSLPNLHFLPADLPVFKKNGISFENDVYVPTDEPHGIIQATVRRSANKAKL